MVTHESNEIVGPKAVRRFKRVRYSYVVLALLSVICSTIAAEVSFAAIRSNNQNFCDLTTSFASPAPSKPVNPLLDPRGERSWVVYNKIIKLNSHLGCGSDHDKL